MPSQNDNGGRRGPWGGGAKPGSDLEDMVRQGQDRLRQIMPTGGPRSAIVLVILALAAFVAWTTYYTVPSDSVAVVQRFGKYLTDVPPGLHFKLPLGIDVATIVPVKRQLKQEFGFATAGATDPYQIPRDAKQEAQMVTGDLNAALVEWVVQYRISDPVKFLFDVREPRGTLRDVSESVMREVVGDRTVDEVITIGRQEIETEALTKMQALATKYAMGISIDQVQLKNINPPKPVQASFNEVNTLEPRSRNASRSRSIFTKPPRHARTSESGEHSSRPFRRYPRRYCDQSRAQARFRRAPRASHGRGDGRRRAQVSRCLQRLPEYA